MAAHASFSQFRSHLLFARMFLRYPPMLGSVIPSSRFLAQRLLRSANWGRDRVVVEYGPGIGNLTREILQRLRPDGVLIAIERSAEFCDYLRQSIPDDRLHVVHGSAEDVRSMLAQHGLRAADCIVSGIPFSTLPKQTRNNILRETYLALAPSGLFLVYQFSKAVLADCYRYFERVEEEFEPRNFLPARIFT